MAGRHRGKSDDQDITKKVVGKNSDIKTPRGNVDNDPNVKIRVTRGKTTNDRAGKHMKKPKD